MDPNVLDRLGGAHHGIVTFRQLVEVGFSRSAIARARRSGVSIDQHRGVYRVAGAPQTWRQQVMAAVSAGSPVAFASHRTSVALFGFPRTRGGIIEIVSEGHAPLRGSHVKRHRTVDLPTADQWVIDAIPVTGIDRTLIDVGRYLGPDGVGPLLDDAVRRGLTTYQRFEDRVQALGRQGRDGIGIARRVLADRGMNDGWGFEAAMSRALRSAGLPTPTREWQLRSHDRNYRVDFGFPSAMLGIECDSTMFHTLPHQFEADLCRQNHILGLGILLLRYTPSRLRNDRTAVIDEIREALNARERIFSGRL